MLGRYVIAPANHIIFHHKIMMQNETRLQTDPASVAQKVTFMTCQLLIARMLLILANVGLQPAMDSLSNDSKEFMKWIVGRDSPWGACHPKGIVGLTQLAFQAHAVKMVDDDLFAGFPPGGDWILKGTTCTFKTPELATHFIQDDYGLKKANNITAYIHKIINGKEPFVLPAANNSFEKFRER